MAAERTCDAKTVIICTDAVAAVNVVVVVIVVVAAVAVHPRTGYEGPKGENTCSSTISLTTALVGVGWSTPRHGHFTSGEDVFILYRRLCGPQGRSGRVRKISPHPSPPPGFDPRTVHPLI